MKTIFWQRSTRKENKALGDDDGERKPIFIFGIYDTTPQNHSGTVLKEAQKEWGGELGTISFQSDPGIYHNGELVVAWYDEATQQATLTASKNRAFQIRGWKEFEESNGGRNNPEEYFLQHMEGFLTPKYSVFTGDLLIAHDNRLYAGFTLDFKRRQVRIGSAGKLKKDRLGDLSHSDVLKKIFYIYKNGAIRYKGDEFMLVWPFKGADVFFNAGEVWEPLAIAQNRINIPDIEVRPALTEDLPLLQSSGEAPSDDEEMAPLPVLASRQSGQASVVDHSELDEITFLEKFIYAVGACGFDYNPQDLIRFHTSVKTGYFTLLGGAPGSGKSSLVKLYAMALLGEGEKMDLTKGLLTIDVNPAWVEPDDVLGYWGLTEKYIPASTGLVPFLRDSIGSDKVRLVCLEEMNLARVEHYFANFMQVFTREEDERYLIGIPQNEESKNTKETLKIDASLRFVGTNNYDETTQNFSARFYDRCNYIELQNMNADTFPEELPRFDKAQFNFGRDKKKFAEWLNPKPSASVLAKDEIVQNQTFHGVKTIYEELRPLFQQLRMAPSPRVRNEILNYIVNRPFFAGCGEGDGKSKREQQIVAFDEAIAQRILPRYQINFLRNEKTHREELSKKFQEFGLTLSKSVLEGKSTEDEC